MDYLNTVKEQYTGITKVQRLKLIAETAQSDMIRKEAAKSFFNVLKDELLNVELYREGLKSFGAFAGEVKDDDWIRRTEDYRERKTEKLSIVLGNSKVNLQPDDMRKANNDLGEHFNLIGEYSRSLKYFLTNRFHLNDNPVENNLDMCLRVIKTSFFSRNYALLEQYVTKAQQSGEPIRDPKHVTTLTVVGALAELFDRKYKSCAKKLLKANISIGDELNHIIIPRDIAAIGVLCCIATFERYELYNAAHNNDSEVLSVLNNNSFSQFLELAPEFDRILHLFYENKFSSCLQAIEQLRPQLHLDFLLKPHVDEIITLIRNRAISIYVTPFTSIDMQKMAEIFNTSVDLLEQELVELIRADKIRARIDSHNKILYKQVIDKRTNTINKINAFAEEYVQSTDFNLLRMNILQFQEQLNPRKRSDKGT